MAGSSYGWGRRLIALGLAGAALVAVVWGGLTSKQATPATAEVAQPAQPAPRVVGALGRVEPFGKVIRLAPPSTQERSRIERLLVREGEWVQSGQAVAVLDSRARLEAALAVAQGRLAEARSRLAQVRAGAKAGEIAAQQATIVRLQAELRGERAVRRAEIARLRSEWEYAMAEARRYELLEGEGAVAASTGEARRTEARKARERLLEAQAGLTRQERVLEAQLVEARSTLDRIKEVRPTDLRLAAASVESARSELLRARAERDLAFVRTPAAGRVLKIHARAGEVVGDRGVAEVGGTDRMAVLAEVYQSDISRIRPGQRATVTGEGFSGELEGRVAEVGLLVNVQRLLSNRPGSDTDRKIVEVRILLTPDSARRVASLSNHQVQTRIWF